MRASVSRADLLLALARAGPAVPAVRLAALLRFVPKPPVPVPPAMQVPGPAVGDSPQQRQDELAAADQAPLQAGRLQAEMVGITRVQVFEPPPVEEPAPVQLARVQAPESQARLPGHVPAFVPLVRSARLWPALRQSLTLPRPAGIDWRQLTQALSLGRAPARLPLASRRVWGGQLWVVIDTGPRMRTSAADVEQVLRLVGRLRGSTGLVIWTVAGRPDQVLGSTLQAVPYPGHAKLPLPPPGTVVLMLSDLGTGARDGAAEAAWLACARRLAQGNALPVAWLPVAPAQVGQALAQSLPVHCLQPGKALRRQAGRWATQAQRQAERQRLDNLLDALCVRAACCVQLDPALLRALRISSPGLRQEPALEALYWTHQPVVRASDVSRPLSPEAAARFRPRLGGIAPAEQLAVLAAMLQHHAGQRRSTEAVEASLWQAHTTVPAHQWPADLAQGVQAARQWLGQLAQSVARPSPLAQAGQGFVRDLLDRQGLDLDWQALHSRQLASLWASTGMALPPPGVMPADLLAAQQRFRPAATALPWRLLQCGQHLLLWPEGQALPAKASPWGAQVVASAVLVAQRGMPRHWLALGSADAQAPMPLVDLAPDLLPAELNFATFRVLVGPVRRPAWALEWARDASGLYALADTPWGQPQRLYRRVTPDAEAYEPLPGAAATQGAAAEAPAAPVGHAEPLVVISASGADRAWRERLLQHLGPLERLGVLSLWHDDSVAKGADWQRQFDAALQRSQVVVMLVSFGYLMSEHVQEREWPSIRARRQAGNFSVLPVLLDTCDWRLLPGLEAFPFVNAGRGLASQSAASADASLAALARQVSRLVEGLARAPSGVAAPGLATGQALLQVAADTEFGLFADLATGRVTQRFRWIPPGEFWMGSPDDEPERHAEEGPRHRVGLSQGLWLADSACTQALWQALMGNNNPSHFKGDDQRPVENVSFDDVQQFLARLQALLPPGCEAVLPTEAQWEYACRAGTDKPFNLPAPISRARANFDASATSVLAEPGEESKATVPVKSLPPNAWGLHEMHGNVWEWCSEDQRDYAGTALRDAALEDPWGPVSQEQEAYRAVRGGASISGARALRSACRARYPRVFRARYLGFRVALRSSPDGSAPEAPPEALGPGPEAPSAPAQRDAGPPPRGWVDRVRDLLKPLKPKRGDPADG